MLARIEIYFNLLAFQCPGRGYHPELSKIVLIVHSENINAGKVFGERHLFKVCTGARYLRGYIGDNESKRNWLKDRTLTWEKNIGTIIKTAGKYTHEIYSTVVRAIQSEWTFLQRMNWDTGDAFSGVKKMIQGTYLPRLFFGRTESLLFIVGDLNDMPVKKAVL